MKNSAGDLRVHERLRTLRDRNGLTQEQLSATLGFKDRQTLAAIEAGERRITPQELVKAAEVLGVTVDHLVDPYRLVGEGSFSFRAKGVEGPVLDAFEELAGRWIATYRQLGLEAGAGTSRITRKLDLSRSSSFEDAQASADELVEHWKLGEKPIEHLREAMRRELGALVLFVDAPPGISGAASQVPGLATILVNRHEPRGRRSYDIVHELFHILTWDAMPPDRVEPWEVKRTKGNRVEQLADNFTAALLMPLATLTRWWVERDTDDLHAWLNTKATALGVSAQALKWRLHNLGFLGKADLFGIRDDRLVANGQPESAASRPPLFSEEFVRRMYDAVEAGRLSLRRAAGLLGLSLPDFAVLCDDYGLTLSYDV
jgi:transcriptional regulator with XRE-family HTH domain